MTVHRPSRRIIYGGGPMYRLPILEKGLGNIRGAFVQIYGQGRMPMDNHRAARDLVA